jgi:hypothetical protein
VVQVIQKEALNKKRRERKEIRNGDLVAAED